MSGSAREASNSTRSLERDAHRCAHHYHRRIPDHALKRAHDSSHHWVDGHLGAAASLIAHRRFSAHAGPGHGPRLLSRNGVSGNPGAVQWQYAFQKRARPQEKRGKIVDPRLLLELGRGLMDSAEQVAQAGERARQYRDGLIIALLVSRPLRRRSFSALELGRTLHVTAGRYVIELHEHDTKAGHPVCFDVPDWLTNYITRYLEQYRPLFPGARMTQALWLSSKGGSLGEDALYDLVCRRTREAFGFAIHPHLFRDIAATAFAREAPGSLDVARDLLTHAKFETTQQYYTQARTADAARVLADALARLRGAHPGGTPTDG